MKASVIKSFTPHILIIFGFVIISLFYFNPVLKGKEIFQSDIMHYIGMAQQQKEFAKNTGDETYWTNSAFGGMPTYQLGAKYPHNYIKSLDLALRFLPRPADYLFLYLIGFYILLLSLKVDFKLAALGALAFGFSTYLIIIIGAGHNAKAHAIAYMPLVIAGILLVFRKKYILGFFLTVIALALELVANHYQMTYYLLLLVLCLGIAFFIEAYQQKTLPHFFKSVGILSIAVIMALGLNATNILATKEYAKHSTRGKSDLTINPDGSPKAATNGLDKDYITEYSYGIVESLNLFIPRLMGGGNSENVGKNSEIYKAYINLGASSIDALEASKNAPMYWGKQPIVEAPAYVGAIIIFLFVLGLFLVKGPLKWWLVSATILSLFLSYGKNLEWLTNFFIDYVPLYDKFRAVSSIQVILELCVPVLGILALIAFFNSETTHREKEKALIYSISITGGLCIFLWLFGNTLFDFKGLNDVRYAEAYGQSFVDAVIKDRKSLYHQDTIRSFVLVLLTFSGLYLSLKYKISKTFITVALSLFILIDLVSINRNYVNNSNFFSGLVVNNPYEPNKADLEILKDTSHFRVLDVASMNNQPAKASFYHNSVLGYHAAKLGRYNDILEFYVYTNNQNILNMLNTKYIIAEAEGQIIPYKNEDAAGNAWFVSEVEKLNSANAEIKSLANLDFKTKAVTTQPISKKSFDKDSTANISLQVAKPNYLKYQSVNAHKGFAVFSEIYYQEGWNAYINGKQSPHQRVNYILRGLEIPRGNNTIEFKFEPQVVSTGSTIALASSIIILLLIIAGVYFKFKNYKQGTYL